MLCADGFQTVLQHQPGTARIVDGLLTALRTDGRISAFTEADDMVCSVRSGFLQFDKRLVIGITDIRIQQSLFWRSRYTDRLC